MRKLITVFIMTLMVATAAMANPSETKTNTDGNIERVLYEHRDYKIVLHMDPSDVGKKCTDEGNKATIMTMKSIALASGWDGWYKCWAVIYPKDSSKDSHYYKFNEMNKCVAAENGKATSLVFEFVTPEDIEEAQKVLDAGCACVELRVIGKGDLIIGELMMFNNDFWVSIWDY